LIYGLLDTLEANQKQLQNLEPEDEELIMSLRTIFQEKQAKIEQEAEKKGIQQGIQQEALLLVIRLLKRKLGDLSPNIETRLKSLSTQQLELLGEDLLDFNSNQDLIDWLSSNQ
jgi:hypothetical protein